MKKHNLERVSNKIKKLGNFGNAPSVYDKNQQSRGAFPRDLSKLYDSRLYELSFDSGKSEMDISFSY